VVELRMRSGGPITSIYQSKILAIIVILVVASLGIGAYIGNISAPNFDAQVKQLTELNARLTSENEALKKAMPSLAGKTVKIGYIASNTSFLQATKPFIEQIIQPDLNSYAERLGNNVTFEFIVEDAHGQANIALDKIQSFKRMGVNFVIGLEWSSQICATMAYANVNKILMVSSSSVSPSCAIANDMVFRMCPAETSLPLSLAEVIWSYGIKELVIIERGDAYGDGVAYLFKAAYNGKGGAITDSSIRYVHNTTDFADYLQQANTQIEAALANQGGDANRVGVLLIAYDEASLILKQASQYPALYSVTWFGADRTAQSQAIMDSAPLEANHVKLLSLIAQKPSTSKYVELESRYTAVTHDDFTIYQAYIYDAAWVVAKSILETGSYDAEKAAAILPSLCEDFHGVSSWCRLNEYGDRAPPPYDVWGYAPGIDKPSESYVAGIYTPDTKLMTWLPPR
jgi:branched-chain amino acid transport system substrate-binding protein